MRFRGKSIRRKIVALLVVPLVSLASLWAFATYITLDDASHLLGHSSVMDKIGHPAETAVQAIQQERRQVMVYLADPRRSDALTVLHRQQQTTDEAVAVIREHAGDGDVGGELPAGHRTDLRSLLAGLDRLPGVREQVEDNTITRSDAYDAYNSVIDPSYRFLSALHTMEDSALDNQGRAVIGIAMAREYLARQDALLAGALAAGHMTQPEVRAFSDRVAERNQAYRTHLAQLPEETRRPLEEYWEGTDARALRKTEEAVIAAGSAGATGETSPELWASTAATVLDGLNRMNSRASKEYHRQVEPAAVDVMIKVGIAGVLGFLALVASLVISIRIGRGLVRDLSALRREAHESAAVRLPSVMRRLAAGDDIDVETEAPRLTYGQDELGSVGQALNTLQRAAVEAAVKQSELRKGVSEVFVNLARRDQVLLHRQLTLLDTMERRTEDPDELADLFRLDHLTTRMRRHAEGLVILSGAAPSRQWRKPVQLMDVVRAAVAEVEDYERVEVRRLPRLAVDGAAVADLTHLIAELIENATVFSPPHTAVQVLGERVPNGFTLEIHDRGLGMNADALLEANLRLAETAEFELSDTDRLGLFVVSRLAHRRGVRVSLQLSPYGGTTAVVLIPGAILTETPARDGRKAADPAAGTGTGDDIDTGDAGDAGIEDTAGSTLAVLAQRPVPLPTRKSAPPAVLQGPLDGPVELEAPVDALGEFDDDGSLLLDRRRLRDLIAPLDGHQQAPDELAAGTTADPAPPGDPIPLPRRTPVLVSDHGRPVAPDQRPHGRPGGRGPVRRPDSEAPAPAGGPEAGPAPGASATVSGLPRRVRQASLAPQLKPDTGRSTSPLAEEDAAAGRAPRNPGGPGANGGGSGWQDRDADEVRSRMAALQRGWQRGREDQVQDTGEPAAERPGPGDTEPGTTPEGNGP